MEQNLIHLVNLEKSFDDTKVLKGINLYIRDKEFLTLLGPSGCGKTTTLRMIAGFETPDAGEILFNGKDLMKLKSYERPINTVFQNYALFPHLNVFDNIAFGLKIQNIPEKEMKERVKEVLRLVNLPNFENRTIDSLSGGQQQRIAIARALVNEPKVLLLDEPLGALDLKLRKQMQFELKRIQEKVGITFIYVTHDQEEALTMSDTIVVMNEGEIQQIGSPIDIYNEPKNAFVANFIGQSNILPAIMKQDRLVEIEGVDFICVDKGFSPNEKVEVVIRPEDVELVEPTEDLLNGLVKSVVFKGVHYEMIVNVKERNWVVQSTVAPEVGKTVGIRVIPDNIHVMKKGD
ncbi:ABC transporter ATP-binding protein [Peptoniphilus sp. KCTC 25270]|uniref:spermidine/putrescine ABC transporter ATP-binding protein n=1 Tax=Peptoniphilus sp. KCTC 25270 TaxID=2897414 RepID=UPI001E2F2276|nr:spermidine/putrescine ABC transporter ATP-binding protein [Peptoniphilus sp. KCTC 25270]MCD1148025.1 ABC transporter ATP-binding protein [Peptoniphilus sp. KCTC 25270]